jgi:glyoxylase-like metal-dependent hydrolase (beta-lactamase superfamily II)
MPALRDEVTTHATSDDVDILGSYYPVPGYGLVPINAFLLHAAQPVLVDTGPVLWSREYLAAIRSVIDLRDLRWIWLTHADPDHIGCLHEVLDAAPDARLVTTFLGLGKLGLYGPLSPERVYLLNPGQSLDVGDRKLHALRPPSYDAPETTAFLDGKTRTLFSSDFCGALLQAPAESAEAIARSELRDGMTLWATVDAPWLSGQGPSAFEAGLARIRSLAPTAIFSTHLPPATGMTDVLLENVHGARTAPPFVGPDQPAFAAMLAAPANEPPPALREVRRAGP